MKISALSNVIAAAALTMAAGSSAAMVVTPNTSATALASAIAGSGITISNASLITATSTAAGTFNGASGAIGFNNGVLLTTGTVNCAVGPNLSTNCGAGGTLTSLKFDFTTTTGNIFFNYVFASEEYNEWVGSAYNDSFRLLLNGVNLALLPGGAGAVSINNVNNSSNSAFYRDNTVLGLDTGYDGLTTVLTAAASGLTGLNTFEFIVEDRGDSTYDSGVFIQAGTFSSTNPTTPTNPVPEPATTALLGLGLLGALSARKRNKQ